VGRGTTFKTYFPEVDARADALEKEIHRSDPSGKRRCWLVEDEEVVGRLAVQIVSKQGYTVLEASNSGEALADFEHIRPHPSHPGRRW